MRPNVHLQRIVIAAALAVLATAAMAQYGRRTPEPSALRAVGVVQVMSTGKARLLPVTLWMQSRYRDASIYRANPAPLALQPEVVYEAQRAGVSAGFFTVTEAIRTADGWFASGRWNRAAGPGEASTAGQGPPQSIQRGDDERPRLHKPQPAPPPPADTVPIAPEPADPNRPVLRRTPGGKHGDAEVPSTEADVVGPTVTVTNEFVAVSDDTHRESRPYTFDWTPDEQHQLSRTMETLATHAVAGQIGAGGGSIKLADVRLHAFDLDTDNVPELVLTASATATPPAPRPVPKGRRSAPPPRSQAAAPSRTFYVTIVARVEPDSPPYVMLRKVTDSSRLDVDPRMELIDAVDANGDGTGELLFRAFGADVRQFVIFQITRDGFTEVFRGTERP